MNRKRSIELTGKALHLRKLTVLLDDLDARTPFVSFRTVLEQQQRAVETVMYRTKIGANEGERERLRCEDFGGPDRGGF